MSEAAPPKLDMSEANILHARFCLKHFRDVTIFRVRNFVMLFEIMLNYLSYATQIK